MTSAVETRSIPWYRSTGFGLAVALLFLYVSDPLLPDAWIEDAVVELLFLSVVVFALRTVTKNTTLLLATVTVSLTVLAVRFSSGSTGPQLSSFVLWIVFLSGATAVFLVSVLRTERITTDKIFASICSYLLFGFLWGIVFVLIYTVDPTAYHFPGEPPADLDEATDLFIYFSFTTLTTLGYGDVSPISGPARAFANLEALIGQLYLAILVARLVALHITHSAQDDSTPTLSKKVTGS